MRWLASAILLIAACDSTGDACNRYASAFCARQSNCSATLVEAGWGDEATCKKRVSAACVAELSAPSTGAGVGELGRCTSALSSQACGHLDEGSCAPPAGSLPLGAQCRYHSQCRSAHCTTYQHWPCGVCEPAPQAGDSCGIGCTSGMACDQTLYQCAAPVAVGAACGIGQPCESHLACVGGSCQPLPPATPSDAACDDTSLCADGGGCFYDMSSRRRCVAPAPDGGSCDLTLGPGCLQPAVCRGDGGSDGKGTCRLPDANQCTHTQVARNSGPPSGAFTPASHDTVFAVPNLGGPILPAPDLVTITWDNYAFRADVDSFGDWIVGSDWLRQVGDEYGVGLGTNTKVHVAGNAPVAMNDAQLEQQLVLWQQDGTIPTPGPNTLYMLYVRSVDTYFTQDPSSAACVTFLGYHYAVDDRTNHFAYSVVASCPQYGAYSELENTEVTAAHELAEAATDPFPGTTPTYRVAGVLFAAGELGDLCDGRNAREGNFAYQRIWSNRAAAAGGDPCIPPNPSDPYFRVEVSPQVSKLIISQLNELSFSAWSTAPTGELQVYVYYLGGAFAPYVRNPYTGDDVTLGYGLSVPLPDAPVIKNGEVGHLTFTLPAGVRRGQTAALAVAASSSVDTYTVWPFVIEADAPSP